MVMFIKFSKKTTLLKSTPNKTYIYQLFHSVVVFFLQLSGWVTFIYLFVYSTVFVQNTVIKENTRERNVRNDRFSKNETNFVGVKGKLERGAVRKIIKGSIQTYSWHSRFHVQRRPQWRNNSRRTSETGCCNEVSAAGMKPIRDT